MICKKIGEDYFNGSARNVWLVYGIATRDAESRSTANGKDYATLNLALGQDEKGEQQYLSCTAWRDRAKELLNVKKRDAVLAIGVMSTRQSGDKTYTNYEVLWFGVSGGAVAGDYSSIPPADVGVPVFAEDDGDDDGELPF
jgi:hypothetical protein